MDKASLTCVCHVQPRQALEGLLEALETLLWFSLEPKVLLSPCFKLFLPQVVDDEAPPLIPNLPP